MDIPSYVNLITSYPIAGRQGQEGFLVIPNGIVNKFVGGWIFSADQQYRSGNLIQLTNPRIIWGTSSSQPSPSSPPRDSRFATGIAASHRWIPITRA